MSYHQTSDDARLARDTRVVVDRDSDSSSRTIMYVVVALVALGLIYLAASAFWGSTDTSVPATSIENTTIVPPAEPDAFAPPPADTITPAPDAMVPATPGAGSEPLDLGPTAPPAVTPAPEPAPAPVQ